MKIGIDARPLQHETQYRGIGKALESVLLALEKIAPPSDEFVFYIDSSLSRPDLLKNFPKSKVISITGTKLGRKRYFRSFLNSFKPLKPSKKDIDVVLQYDASFGVPTNVPSVVVFHDMIPYLFRGQEKQRLVKGPRKAKDALARKMYWDKYLRVLKEYKKASRVAAISQSSKDDLLKHFPSIKPSNVSVVHLGLNKLQSDGQPSAEIKKLASEPYLLYVGGIDIRKNILGLIDVFYQLKPTHQDLKLVVVGKEFKLEQALKDLGWFAALKKNNEYAKDVVDPGFLSTADLLFVYEHASVFVFPSRYEGFGLPVIEAMNAGCPVVAYKNSSIPEVAGEAALLVEDGASLTPSVERILSNESLRKKLIENGHKRSKLFSWDKTAKETLNLLHEAAKQLP